MLASEGVGLAVGWLSGIRAVKAEDEDEEDVELVELD